MSNYELLYIVSSQYTEEELAKIRQKIDETLKKQGAIIGYQEFLGKKKLAYPIKKNVHGYYVAIEFELAESKNLQTINNELKLDRDILRAQIISRAKTAKRLKKKIREKIEIKPSAPEYIFNLKNKISSEKKEAKPIEDKKTGFKNLDEKLDEILKDDGLI